MRLIKTDKAKTKPLAIKHLVSTATLQRYVCSDGFEGIEGESFCTTITSEGLDQEQETVYLLAPLTSLALFAVRLSDEDRWIDFSPLIGTESDRDHLVRLIIAALVTTTTDFAGLREYIESAIEAD